MDYAQLKLRHRAERGAWHPNLSLRVHRALSWLDRAEQLGSQDDADGQFILLWIAFNISRIADALRAAGGTVAWVLPTNSAPTAASTEFYGEKVAAMYAASGGEGSLAERLWHEFTVHEGDVLAEKSATSAFFHGRSTLPPQLEARGVDTVLVTGTLTNICCESTARDASTLGLRVIMVADANAARRTIASTSMAGRSRWGTRSAPPAP